MASPFVAEIRMFGFNFAPTGWAQCDGQLLPISQNTALFSLLGTFYGGDGKSTFALPYYVGLVKGAPHSENGKKLIDFLLSKDAQSTITSVALGIPVRSDVEPSTDIKAMMDGVEVWTPDWTAVLKDLEADVGRWHEATGS